jgi:hypothetical protein
VKNPEMFLTYLTGAHKYVSGVCSITLKKREKENYRASPHIDLFQIITAMRNDIRI